MYIYRYMRVKMIHLTLLWLTAVSILGDSSTSVTKEHLRDVIQLTVNKRLRDILPNADYSTMMAAENDITKCISDLLVSKEGKTLLDHYPNKLDNILEKICPNSYSIENCLLTYPKWDTKEISLASAECAYRCSLGNPFPVEKCFHNYMRTDESLDKTSVQKGAIETFRKMFYALCSIKSTLLSDLDDSSTSDCILENLWKIDGCFSHIYSSRTESSQSTCSFVDEVMSCLKSVVDTCQDAKLMTILKLLKDTTLQGSECVRAGIEDLSFKPPREGLLKPEIHKIYSNSLLFFHDFFLGSALGYLSKCKGLTENEFVQTNTFQDLYSYKKTLDNILRINFRCCRKPYSLSDALHTIVRHRHEIIKKHKKLFRSVENCFDEQGYNTIKKVVLSTLETLAEKGHKTFLINDLDKFLDPTCLINSVQDASTCFDKYLPEAEKTYFHLYMLLECLEDFLVKCDLVEDLKKEGSYIEFKKDLLRILIHHEYMDRKYFSRDKKKQMMNLMDVECSTTDDHCVITDKVALKESYELTSENSSEDGEVPVEIYFENEEVEQLFGSTSEMSSAAVEEITSKVIYSNNLASKLMDNILLDIYKSDALSGSHGNMDFITLLEYECRARSDLFDDFLSEFYPHMSAPRKTVLDSWVQLAQSFITVSCDLSFLEMMKPYKDGFNSCISKKWSGLTTCAKLATSNHLEQQEEKIQKLGAKRYSHLRSFFHNDGCLFSTQLLDCAKDVLTYCKDTPPIGTFVKLKDRVLREMKCSQLPTYAI